jgi:RNA polymerase sigma-70 factor, ECF subfamily
VPPEPATDRSDLLALQQGEAAALNRLIVRWQHPLHHFAYRYVQNTTDAADLVAAVFVRLYQQRLRLRPDTKLSAWLFTTLANLCHNHHRWKRRHPTLSLDAPDDESGRSTGMALVADLPLPHDQLESQELVAAVRTAIDRLPHDLKVTLLLHQYDQLSHHEIGEITGCSVRGVETRLYRARKQLRLLLEHYINPPQLQTVPVMTETVIRQRAKT